MSYIEGCDVTHKIDRKEQFEQAVVTGSYKVPLRLNFGVQIQ